MENIVKIFESDPTGAEISERDVTDDEILKIVAYLKEKWTSPMTERFGALESARRFNLETEYLAGTLLPTGTDGLERRFKLCMFAMTRIEMQLYMRHLVDIRAGSVAEDVAGTEIGNDIRRILYSMSQLYRCLRSDIMARKALDPTFAAECPSVRDNIVLYDSNTFDDWHTFYMYVIQKIFEHGYARYQGACYEQIESPPIDDGAGNIKRFNTHAWRRACSLEEFVSSVANKEQAFHIWKVASGKNNTETMVKFLRTLAKEREFPDLVPNRHWHSFRNGLYFTREGTFYPFGSKEIPPDVVACKYHDMEFTDTVYAMTEDNWYDIPTPNVQRILEYQLSHLPKHEMDDVIMWVYVFLGRLLFEVGDKDGWQVIFFLMGRAGTGKSRLIDAATSFFQEEDIGVLANNSARDFGLETFIGKLCWACYEVKHDFTLDQANFQSMVTGEKVVIQRKNKTAESVIWKIPGILAGNEPGGWRDNSGSISRRIVLLKFDKKVQSDKLDPNLDKKIKLETPNFLHKCCRAYLSATSAYGSSDIWKEVTDENGQKQTILPKYFHIQKERLVELTHPLASFLRNFEPIVLIQNTGMPFDRFKVLAKDYFEANNYPKFNWKEDKYKAVMEDFGVSVAKLTASYLQLRGDKKIIYNGQPFGQGVEWCFGVTEREFLTEAEIEE